MLLTPMKVTIYAQPLMWLEQVKVHRLIWISLEVSVFPICTYNDVLKFDVVMVNLCNQIDKSVHKEPIVKDLLNYRIYLYLMFNDCGM